jgi:hypothetical protein
MQSPTVAARFASSRRAQRHRRVITDAIAIDASAMSLRATIESRGTRAKVLVTRCACAVSAHHRRRLAPPRARRTLVAPSRAPRRRSWLPSSSSVWAAAGSRRLKIAFRRWSASAAISRGKVNTTWKWCVGSAHFRRFSIHTAWVSLVFWTVSILAGVACGRGERARIADADVPSSRARCNGSMGSIVRDQCICFPYPREGTCFNFSARPMALARVSDTEFHRA